MASLCGNGATWEQEAQASMTPYFDVAEKDMDVCPGDASLWHADFRTPHEKVCSNDDGLTDQRNAQLSFYIDTSEMPLRAPQEAKVTGTERESERVDAYQGSLHQQGDSENPWGRYNAVPASQRPSMPGWNNNVNLPSWESYEVSKGPVWQRYFSDENIRQIGDWLQRAGHGRPSRTELYDDMVKVMQEMPDFWEFGPIRTLEDVQMQVMRLDSLLLQDLDQKYRVAKWSWMRYQQDAQYGIGPQLIDRPLAEASARNYTEFANRF